jgi:ABC-2 type transport system ATP-binding protein
VSLRLIALTKTYGRQTALDDVSLHVRRGDCYGFLGHNGAGKTTTLRIALGLTRPDRGQILVDGVDARVRRADANARLGGLIETPGFHDGLSGAANLELLAGLHGIPRRAARLDCGRLLESVGLSTVGDKPLRAYSQGMRQRLGIAQALLGDPPYVLLDEPTNGLDPEGIEEMRVLIRRLTRDDGRTVVLSSHQLHELSGLCNRIAILRQGRLVVEDETSTLLGSTTRHRLDCGDRDAAARVLGTLGLTVADGDGTAVRFSAAGVPTERVAAAVVAAGLPLRTLAPEPSTLEEIYLRFTRAEAQTSPARMPVVSGDDDRGPPVPHTSRVVALGRMARHELRRFASGPAVPLLIALPSLLGVAGVVRLWADARGLFDEVQAGQLFSQSLVTAYEGVAVGLAYALPTAALVMAGIGSQSVAGESARGTLRNVALRPLDRWTLGLGKALAVCGAAGLTFVLAVCAVVGVSAALFDFTDVVEILEIRTARPITIVSAAELDRPFRHMLLVAGVPLAACGAIGLFFGSITRSPTRALALSAGALVALDLGRVFGRIVGHEGAFITAHLPTPLGDTSAVAGLLHAIRAPNDAASSFADGTVPNALIWTSILVASALIAVRRREIR